MDDEPCLHCGREEDDCVCHLAADFPMDAIEGIDDDFFDWDYYEETNDAIDRSKDSGPASQD
jgi:hypothetical protein